MTTSSSGEADLVIALPEHALEWNENRLVTDLAPYVIDPIYGMDVSDIPFVFWNQDEYADVRVAMPAQRTARFLLWNETWAGELGFDASPDAPEDFIQSQLKGIIGLEIEVTNIFGKTKMSQNRSSEDRAGVVEGLETRGGSDNLLVADAVRSK